MKLNFEELPQATAFLLEKVEELTISINEMKQLLKRQTTAKEEMIGINEACEILSLAKPTVYALVQANKIPYYQPGKMLINPEKPDVPLNKNDAFQKVQKRRVQEKR